MAVVVLPLLGAAFAAWMELREPGGTAMWLVAAALFLFAPGIAAWALQHSAAPTTTRSIVALVGFAVILGLWLVNVPVRTQPGLYFPGGTPLSGAFLGVLIPLAWSFAVARAQAGLRGRWPDLAFVIGAIWLAVLSPLAFYAALSI